MPPRIARSGIQPAAPKTARNKNRKRNFDAFAIASHSVPAKPGLRKNRLGEFLDDEPRQKRQRASKKDDEDDSGDDDVPVKRRRPNDNDNGVEEGSDSDGNEWTLGGLREDDEDSDLDSDEAFGASDEERFAGFTFRGSSSRKGGKALKRKAHQQRSVEMREGGDVDLDEGDAQDGSEEDDFGDEGVDLATMLDDRDEEVLGEKDTTLRDMGDEDSSVDDQHDANESESESEPDEDEDDVDAAADEERLARMRDHIEGLESATQQPTKPETASTRPALTLNDLMSVGLDTSARQQHAKERKRSKQVKVFSAPLPPRQQNRINREVASQKAKEQLDRWRDTVIQNRRAEFLSFPLKDPDRGELAGKDKFVASAPQNELEENIRRIMEESGMGEVPEGDEDGEDAGLKSEGLAEKQLSLEEVTKKRAELRRARELLFREESKAKRIAKIKSKAYRRVHRKERARLAERERELLGEVESREEQKEKADRKRAEARMNTKHKDSKWAKTLKATNKAVWDEGAREGMNDLARRNEDLHRRIAGEELSDDEGGASLSDGDSDAEDSGAMLEQLDRVHEDGGDQAERKGLAGLKFMVAAEERRKKQNDQDVERLRKELAVEDGDEDDDSAIDDQGLGRAIFGPKGKEKPEKPKKIKRPELEEGDRSEDEDDEEIEVVTNKAEISRETKRGTDKTAAKARAADRTNGNNDHNTVRSDNTPSEWITAPTKSSKKGRRLRGTDNDTLLDLEANKQKTNDKAPSKSTRQPKESNADNSNTDGWTQATHKHTNDTEASDDDSGSEDQPSNPILTAEQHNSEYYRRAFEADNVKAAFDAEKAEAADSEDGKETSNYMPGWGSWTGEGLSKSVRKANARQRHNPLFKTKLPGVKPDDRKDAKLENVIISEKQDRKGKKYKADILPHGFERKQQYERALRVPMGPEWVTKETFQRNTRPRVVVKPGVVISAMERPLV